MEFELIERFALILLIFQGFCTFPLKVNRCHAQTTAQPQAITKTISAANSVDETDSVAYAIFWAKAS